MLVAYEAFSQQRFLSLLKVALAGHWCYHAELACQNVPGAKHGRPRSYECHRMSTVRLVGSETGWSQPHWLCGTTGMPHLLAVTYRHRVGSGTAPDWYSALCRLLICD